MNAKKNMGNRMLTSARNGSGVSGYGKGWMLVVAAVLAIGAIPAAAKAELVARLDGDVLFNNDELIFDDTAIGQSSQFVITLRNESSETIQFTENPPVMMAGGFPESFELIQPALESGNVLSPNGSTAFLVRMSPEFRFQRLFTHLYVWTDASATPLHLIVSGKATGPAMFVSLEGEEIPDLGGVVLEDTEVGETTEFTLLIENIGDAELAFTDDPPALLGGGFAFDFEVTQQPEPVLAPGETTEVTVAFTPSQVRPYFTRLFIATNEVSAQVNQIYDIDINSLSFEAPVVEDPAEEDPIVEEDPIDEDPTDEDVVDEEPIDDGPVDDGVVEEDPIDEPTQEQPVEDNVHDHEMTDDTQQDEDALEETDNTPQPQTDSTDDEFERIPVSGMCGAGGGSAGLATMLSLGGMRLAAGRRRRRKA